MANVGVIGLGAMGAPMARKLLKGGHTVTVFARRARGDGAAHRRRRGGRLISRRTRVAQRRDDHDGDRYTRG